MERERDPIHVTCITVCCSHCSMLLFGPVAGLLLCLLEKLNFFMGVMCRKTWWKWGLVLSAVSGIHWGCWSVSPGVRARPSVCRSHSGGTVFPPSAARTHPETLSVTLLTFLGKRKLGTQMEPGIYRLCQNVPGQITLSHQPGGGITRIIDQRCKLLSIYCVPDAITSSR